MLMDLVDKIRKVEALIAGAKTEGERKAAEFAKQRLEGKIGGQLIEYTVRLRNSWTKKLFVAICRKYQLRTYRYAKQRYTTTMVQVSSAFLNGVLWPEFNKYDSMFQELASEIIQDLVSKIYKVDDVAEEIIAGELPSTTELAAL